MAGRSAESYILALDAALGRVGEDVVLQRYAADDDTGAMVLVAEITARVNVRSSQPQELIAAAQPDSLCNMSPTSLLLWPDNMIEKDDIAIIQGVPARIQYVNQIRINGDVVRINFKARG